MPSLRSVSAAFISGIMRAPPSKQLKRNWMRLQLALPELSPRVSRSGQIQLGFPNGFDDARLRHLSPDHGQCCFRKIPYDFLILHWSRMIPITKAVSAILSIFEDLICRITRDRQCTDSMLPGVPEGRHNVAHPTGSGWEMCQK